MTITIDCAKLDLPLHPGDIVFCVSENDGQYEIYEETVASVVISQDNTMQFIIDSYVEEFGPLYQIFPTRAEAENYVSELQASLPRRITPKDTSFWYSPNIWLPVASMEVILTLLTPPEYKPDRSIYAYYVRGGECMLPDGFYIISPSAYDENFDIQVDRLNVTNTERVPDDRIFAWKDIDEATSYVSHSLPLKLEDYDEDTEG